MLEKHRGENGKKFVTYKDYQQERLLMHYHCEIVLPPNVENIEDAVASVMKPFDENNEDLEEFETRYAFYDYYVIGGRFAGSKALAGCDKEKLKQFEQWLKDEKITVSSLRCGKEELNPADQIGKVDAKWNEMFPSDDGNWTKCPIFQHSNDQYSKYGKGIIEGDICKLRDAKEIACGRIIFAAPCFDVESKTFSGPLKAVFMLCEDEWNGVNHMKIDWDGKVSTALEQFIEWTKHYSDEYRELATPNDDWITVTVDYHC